MKSQPVITSEKLEALYRTYNLRAYVHPDPLEFLYEYDDLRDREIAGLVASSLAYGRVAQILKSVRTVLDLMGPSPADFLESASLRSLQACFKGFRHRFATGEHLAFLLMGARGIIREYESLHDCLAAGMKTADDTILPAMTFFCGQLVRGGSPGHLVPLPERGSACKRMNLFLRWMVRKDAVDPGGWDSIPPDRLIIPLDVHMHRICTALGLTARKQADMRTASEITAGFVRWAPEDPVRYDFALTRFGIRDDMNPESLTAWFLSG